MNKFSLNLCVLMWDKILEKKGFYNDGTIGSFFDLFPMAECRGDSFKGGMNDGLCVCKD